ncbi:hypothetical protein [Singulisphaera sp. PoT]|uniref:hypothetical protein n=1 Tax=Singulisphaera sp. PoT TaxID=3411797 RepID=UPI003BF5A790
MSTEPPADDPRSQTHNDAGASPAASPSSSRSSRSRPFGLADGMILVAATATGLSLSRKAVDVAGPTSLWRMIRTLSSGGCSFEEFVNLSVELGIALVLPTLASWTFGCLLLRLRAPRPSRRRFTRQPGAMASLAASTVIGLSLAVALLHWLLTDRAIPKTSHVFGLALFVSMQVGVVVSCCWSTMIVSRGYVPEPTWLDRLGRLLGAAWIAVAVPYGYVAISLWDL